MQFIGRENELSSLATLRSRGNTIAVIYGRRRVGKSLLIRHFLRRQQAPFFEGLEGQSTQRQLRNFIIQLNHQTGRSFLVPKSWTEAFLSLETVLKESPAWVVLDEFQWMGNYRSQIVSELKMAWDQYLSRIPNVSLILCGSIASFMTKKVIKSRALYGRTDLVIHLREFLLAESHLMLPEYGMQELLDAQAILGGVPKYLELLKGHSSLYTALDQLAFSETGYLTDEFDRIFISHFASNDDYARIIDALAQHPYGLYRKELSAYANIDIGGGLTNHLFNLESAGFIHSIYPIDKSTNSRLIKYYLSDAYLRFYYAFIKPNLSQIKNGPNLKFSTLAQQPLFQSWRGTAFEHICRQHASKIAEILGFSGVNYRVGPYFRPPQKNRRGVQIDLIFDRDDNILNLCEIKTSRGVIKSGVLEEIESKRSILQDIYPRHTISPVLIYDGQLSKELERSPMITHKIEACNLI
jgi:AAA+ ATPase superfamily predicted ATPase